MLGVREGDSGTVSVSPKPSCSVRHAGESGQLTYTSSPSVARPFPLNGDSSLGVPVRCGLATAVNEEPCLTGVSRGDETEGMNFECNDSREGEGDVMGFVNRGIGRSRGDSCGESFDLMLFDIDSTDGW